jgi:hypothetical protein
MIHHSWIVLRNLSIEDGALDILIMAQIPLRSLEGGLELAGKPARLTGCQVIPELRRQLTIVAWGGWFGARFE